jgi:imidazolonepropionase-like amidohydrolase
MSAQTIELLISLLSRREEIASAYKLLDPHNAHDVSGRFDAIDKLLQAAEQGYAEEYRLAHHYKEGRGFGPKAWHTDSSEESYKKSWRAALDAVMTVGKNPKAHTFQQELVASLLSSIDYAKEDIPLRYPEKSKEQRNLSFLQTLEESRSALLRLQSA